MCLLRPRKNNDPRFRIRREKKNMIGYKVFIKTDDELQSMFYDNDIDHIPIGIWINERKYREYEEDEEIFFGDTTLKTKTYPIGFHCYLRRKDAEYVSSINEIRKIYMKGIVQLGYENNKSKKLKVVVAKQIKVLMTNEEKKKYYRGRK